MGCLLSKNRGENNTIPQVECVVCFNEANRVLYPCGHYCICNDCAMQMSQNDRSRLGDIVYVKLNVRRQNGLFCPICRRLGLPTKIFPNSSEDYNTI